MAFLINEVGIERGATKVLFDAPPIIMERHKEGGPSIAYALSISNQPVSVHYHVDQEKAFLTIKLEQLDIAQVNLLESLMSATGYVYVKLKPGDATVLQCTFGPRSKQKFQPYNNDYPESDKAGGTLTPVLTQYRVTLMLLRM